MTNGELRNETASRIMVALDYPDLESTATLLRQLEGIPCYMKVGMQLFYAVGPQIVDQLKCRGYRVFLDLKLHDIPHTVKGAARSISQLGVDMFNVHAAGGKWMMEAALEGTDQAAGHHQPTVIAVTQLTSTDQLMMNEQMGIPGLVKDSVLNYAILAKQTGLHGVVASAHETAEIKRVCGPDFAIVTPGIRPLGAETHDQSRVMTPAQAVRLGADYLVIGRPITHAADPRLALENIIEELQNI